MTGDAGGSSRGGHFIGGIDAHYFNEEYPAQLKFATLRQKKRVTALTAGIIQLGLL